MDLNKMIQACVMGMTIDDHSSDSPDIVRTYSGNSSAESAFIAELVTLGFPAEISTDYEFVADVDSGMSIGFTGGESVARQDFHEVSRLRIEDPELVILGVGGWFKGDLTELQFVLDGEEDRTDFSWDERMLNEEWRFIGLTRTNGFKKLEVLSSGSKLPADTFTVADQFTLVTKRAGSQRNVNQEMANGFQDVR